MGSEMCIRDRVFGIGIGAGSFLLLLFIFGSPSEKNLLTENSRLQAQYNILSRRLDEALHVMQRLQQRDDNLYRVIMQANPVTDALRTASYGKTNRYEEWMDMANSKLVVNTTQKMDLLARQVYIQSKSFDEVVELCKRLNIYLPCQQVHFLCSIYYQLAVCHIHPFLISAVSYTHLTLPTNSLV